MNTNESVTDDSTNNMPNIKKVNYFYDFYYARIPFLSNHNTVYLSISQKNLESIESYEKTQREIYGDKYKSIIYNKERPLIKVKYDDKSKYYDMNGNEKEFKIEKMKYKKVTLQAKNIYDNTDICTTHWRIHNILENKPQFSRNFQVNKEPMFVQDTDEQVFGIVN